MYPNPLNTQKNTVKPVLRGHLWDLGQRYSGLILPGDLLNEV